MSNRGDNLLMSLSRWASGQHENFLTDAFVHLLNRLAGAAPTNFGQLLERLTRGAIHPAEDLLADFRVASQVSTDMGIPDIAISGPGHYVLVEVKDQSPVDPGQLRLYSKVIEERPEEHRCLVSLIRHLAPVGDVEWLVEPVKWSEVAEWLGEMRDDPGLDNITRHTIGQFLGYLEGIGMAVERVGWELLPGLEQLMNLRVLLREALESVGVHKVWTAYGAEFNGMAIPDPETNTTSYYFYVHYEDPGDIRFVTYIEKVRPDRLSTWQPHSNTQVKRVLRADSESTHFFARTLSSQKNLLEEFAASCLADTTYAAPAETESSGGLEV